MTNKKSYITPSFINELVIKYGFDSATLKGGDFKGAKKEAIELTELQRFNNPKDKLNILRALEHSYNMVELYTALYNIMHARLNPTEKLSLTKIMVSY